MNEDRGRSCPFRESDFLFVFGIAGRFSPGVKTIVFVGVMTTAVIGLPLISLCPSSLLKQKRRKRLHTSGYHSEECSPLASYFFHPPSNTNIFASRERKLISINASLIHTFYLQSMQEKERADILHQETASFLRHFAIWGLNWDIPFSFWSI